MKAILYIVSFVCLGHSVWAQVPFKLANILQSNMVIQQDRPFRLWGRAPEGEIIQIRADWMNKMISVKADASSRWSATIDVPKAIPGRFDKHSITVIHQQDTVNLVNLLIGEVWVCGGQSNMEMAFLSPWGKVNNATTEMAAANYPEIRLLQVEHFASTSLQDDIKGTWQACTPQSVRNFSAVAYFFGRGIFRDLQIPIGLVHSSWGGTVAEDWTSAGSLQKMPFFAAALRKLQKDSLVAGRKQTLDDANRPSVLFNAMIHPLLPLSIRGVIWFQGESNSGRAYQYRQLFPLMITDWREHWGIGNFPFYYVQLANLKFGAVNDVPKESFWAELREAQLMALKLPNTGMAVTVDIGDPDNVHFGNKQEVGRRLALIARAKTYGEDTSWSGPIFKKMKIKGNIARLSFDHTDKGLKSRGDSALTGFAMAGADRKFYWARAWIHGSEVWVSCPQVSHPVAVRYGWANSPDCNLYNGAGLPASPFRTDDWLGVTYGKE